MHQPQEGRREAVITQKYRLKQKLIYIADNNLQKSTCILQNRTLPCYLIITGAEAVARKCSTKYVHLKISQNSNKTPVLPVKSAKFLRTPFLQTTGSVDKNIQHHLVW